MYNHFTKAKLITFAAGFLLRLINEEVFYSYDAILKGKMKFLSIVLNLICKYEKFANIYEDFNAFLTNVETGGTCWEDEQHLSQWEQMLFEKLQSDKVSNYDETEIGEYFDGNIKNEDVSENMTDETESLEYVDENIKSEDISENTTDENVYENIKDENVYGNIKVEIDHESELDIKIEPLGELEKETLTVIKEEKELLTPIKEEEHSQLLKDTSTYLPTSSNNTKPADQKIITEVHYCPVCGAAYANKDSLQFHFEFKHKGKFYQCEQCGYKARTRSDLAKHKFVVKFYCDQCSFHSVRRSQLKMHLETVHNTSV